MFRQTITVTIKSGFETYTKKKNTKNIYFFFGKEAKT